ncbi:MAG: transcriptional regulator [Chromatiales bacterium 21-64-14]|nr:MAG: transcriptional regulator [Chromatiales bacterium 21-64-14]HQU16298.1 helix-turn-helix transcriptional regulator [Gammaproteobacteria bacterium]
MKISKLLTDDAILAEIGARVARRRLDLQLTQGGVAEQAGIAKRTVERIEAGASAQVASIIRILRVLDLLPGLDRVVPEAGPTPMDLLKRKGKVRQRASTHRHADASDPPWHWDDDA